MKLQEKIQCHCEFIYIVLSLRPIVLNLKYITIHIIDHYTSNLKIKI